MTGPYSACHTSKDDKPYMYGISGPGNGIGYNAWYLYPENAFYDYGDAERVAKLMNMAFEEGRKAQQTAIKNALGI